ncbi:unnamed protein product [Pleuronectes platessa]|uniref:Uncharacterized protein n=1 Tax=Pleuronectes platessa TaxID=8262 RepID=A0A9N7V3D9_PLEPL|nr:unnamed protein product [Pleuronectes platessa]
MGGGRDEVVGSILHVSSSQSLEEEEEEGPPCGFLAPCTGRVYYRCACIQAAGRRRPLLDGCAEPVTAHKACAPASTPQPERVTRSCRTHAAATRGPCSLTHLPCGLLTLKGDFPPWLGRYFSAAATTWCKPILSTLQ